MEELPVQLKGNAIVGDQHGLHQFQLSTDSANTNFISGQRQLGANIPHWHAMLIALIDTRKLTARHYALNVPHSFDLNLVFG